jgi:hypothetical protein
MKVDSDFISIITKGRNWQFNTSDAEQMQYWKNVLEPIIDEVTKPAGDYPWEDISGNATDIISTEFYVPLGPWEAVIRLQAFARVYLAKCQVASIIANMKSGEESELLNAAGQTITRWVGSIRVVHVCVCFEERDCSSSVHR